MSELAEKKKSKFTVYDMAVVGVFAAIIFVITYFIRIPIETPVGETNLKLANVFCLLAGMLFGGLRGGLAAGIGSMLFDLLNPKYIASAPFTLINFFMMAFICGIICFVAGKKGNNLMQNIIGAICGAFAYVLLYSGKSVIELVIAGSNFSAAFTACVPKMITSTINAVFAIVASNLLAPLLRIALKQTGFYSKMKI